MANAEKPIAVATLISGGKGYYLGALAQKIALDRYARSADHVVMVEDGAYPQSAIDNLKQLGWRVVIVPAIRSRPAKFKARRWPRTFTKINLWNLTDYSRVVYIDADACPMARIDELFRVEFETIAACCMKRPCQKPPHFNAGMIVMRPDADEFARLLEFTTKVDPAINLARYSDQGVLNAWYKGNFRDLPDKFNVRRFGRNAQAVIAHMRPHPWVKRARSGGIRQYVNRWKMFLTIAQGRLQGQTIAAVQRKAFQAAPRARFPKSARRQAIRRVRRRRRK